MQSPGLPHKVDFLGAPLSVLTMQRAVQLAAEAIATGKSWQQGCLSSAVLARLQSDSVLRDAFWSFDLVTADGQGIVWGARALGYQVPHRISGIDLMEALLAEASRTGYRVYFLGAEPHVLDRALEVVAQTYRGVVVAGAHHGYFSSGEEARVVDEINSSSSDLLFVALPTPAKELFLKRNRGKLDVRFCVGVGGSLDVVAGLRWRAPRWMRSAGLEWLARLVQEPRRLGPRFLVGNSRYVRLVVAEFLQQRTRRAEEV